MSSSCSSNNGSMEFSQVSDRLVYKVPNKKDFPKSTNNWKDGLNNILAAVEKSDKEGKSTYDMVSVVFFICVPHFIHNMVFESCQHYIHMVWLYMVCDDFVGACILNLYQYSLIFMKYPKAKYHLLLMSRKNAGKLCHVDTLNDLEPKSFKWDILIIGTIL